MASAGGNLVVWTGVLVVFIIAGVVGLVLAKRIKLWSQEDRVAEPFTLQDLREMHQRGEISATEFETMRAGMIDRYKTASEPRANSEQEIDGSEQLPE